MARARGRSRTTIPAQVRAPSNNPTPATTTNPGPPPTVTLQVLMFIVDEPKKSINKESLRKVERALENVQGDKLYLVIQTRGGDPFSAVRIMKVIHKKFREVISIVPSHAMSAGTLMALGTNKIYMQAKSMLGPLDLPSEHPNDGSWISALDFRNTITTLAGLSDTIADVRYKFLRNKCGLGKKDAAKEALSTATHFMEPIVKQIDPYHLQKSVRELKIGWWYAYDLLVARMMATNPSQAWDTAKTLVNDFPAHDYGIFSNDARLLLSLAIEDLDTLAEWRVIKPVFDTIDNLGNDAIVRKEVDYAQTP